MPENQSAGVGVKQFDAIVDGRKTEFKAVTGGLKAISKRFREALKQGDDVYITTTDKDITAIYSKILGEVKDILSRGKTLDGGRRIYLSLGNGVLYKWELTDIIKVAQALL